MSTLKKCRGCGSSYAVSEAGGKCSYCGMALEASLVNSSLDEILYNARSLRRTGDFQKAREEYLRVLKENSNIKEAYFGLFLCEYQVSEYQLEKSQVKYCKCFTCNKTPVGENDFFQNAVSDSLNQELWRTVGLFIEKSRRRNVAVRKNLPEYSAILLCNEGNKKDFDVANILYEKLKDKIDIFFPPVTLGKINLCDRHAYTMLALKTTPVMFVFSSDKAKNIEGSEISIYYKEYLNEYDSFHLVPIVPDEDSIPADMFDDPDDADSIEYDEDEIDIDDIVAKMLKNVRVIFPTAGKHIRSEGKYFLNGTNESPIVQCLEE